MRKLYFFALQALFVSIFFFVLPKIVDYKMNGLTPSYTITVSEKVATLNHKFSTHLMQAVKLHRSLEHIADFHADSLLWDRDMLTKRSYGHVDIPRLLEGNIALQGFLTLLLC